MQKEIIIVLIAFSLWTCSSERPIEGGYTAMNIGMILRKYVQIQELSTANTKEEIKQKLLVSQLLTEEKRLFYLDEMDKVDSVLLENEKLKLFISKSCFIVDKESALSCEYVKQMQEEHGI